MSKYIVILLVILLVPVNTQALSDAPSGGSIEFNLVDYNTHDTIMDQGFLFVKIGDDLITIDWYNGAGQELWVFEGDYLKIQAFVDGYQPRISEYSDIPRQGDTGTDIVTIVLIPTLIPELELSIVEVADSITLLLQMPQAPPIYQFGYEEFTDWGIIGKTHTTPLLVFASTSVLDNEWYYGCRRFAGPTYCYYVYEMSPISSTAIYALADISRYYLSNINISITLLESLDVDNIELSLIQLDKTSTLWIENVTRSEASVIGNISVISRSSYYNFYHYYSPESYIVEEPDDEIPDGVPFGAPPITDLYLSVEEAYVLGAALLLVVIVICTTRKGDEER